YACLQWLVPYSEKKQPISWPPPALATLGNPHSQKEQIHIRALPQRERQVYPWMNEPPLPDMLIPMFGNGVHDSVAHTPDPLGDFYFSARDIFYQKDTQQQESVQIASA